MQQTRCQQQIFGRMSAKPSLSWALSLAFMMLRLAALCNACSPDQLQSNTIFSASDFQRCATVKIGHDGQVGSVLFYWRWVGGAQGKVTIAAQFPTDQGWVAFGLSEGGSMFGADLWIFRKENSGTWVVQDYHSKQPGTPVLDVSQDVTLLGASSSGGKTFVMAERKTNTCPSGMTRDEDLTFVDATRPFLFAWGSSYTVAYHGEKRGVAWLNLATDVGLNPLPADVRTVLIKTPNATVPRDDSTQYCRTLHTLPSDRKYHLVRFEATLVSDHPELVHHMILYSCTGTTSTDEVNQDVICNGKYLNGTQANTNGMRSSCMQFLVIWPMGAVPFDFPPDVGLPFGVADDFGAPTSVMLEVHYDNPNNVSFVDESGLTLYYTPTLRQNDASILTLGHMNINLAPGAPSTILRNECPAECTLRMKGPVTVLQSVLHMHQTGKSIYTQHIRDDEELEPLGQRRSWDFNQQTAMPVARVVQPGDRLITYCEYDTSQRTKPTMFGESTLDEMCFNFMLVYPASNIMACIQMFDTRTKTDMGISLCLQADAAQLFFNNPSSSDLSKALGSIVKPAAQDDSKMRPYVDEVCRTAQSSGACPTGGPSALSSALLLGLLSASWAIMYQQR